MSYKTYLTNNFNSSKFRLNGLIPSSRLPNKRQLCQSFRNHILYSADQLPPKVDLRSDMTPVEDQSRIGSCSANCLAGAYEYLTKKANGRNTDVSRLFIYYNARVLDNQSAQVVDSGCTMTSAIEALEQFGTCLESLWMYDISRVNTRPDDQAYQEAQRHKITEAFQVGINLYEMKACLAQGFPFAFGLKLYSSFDQAAQTGVVPMPISGDNGRQSDGSHALLAVGYSDQSNAFIVRNSWGEQWGDNGYCYIPYAYVTNSNLCFDVWTVRKLAMNDFGQENWDTEDTVNYLQRKNHGFQGNSEIIQDLDDNDDDINRDNDYGQNSNFDDLWNSYRTYGGNKYRKNGNGDDYYGIYRNDNFDDPWNSYQNYGGNNYSKNDYYGVNGNNDYGQNDPWNPYRRNNYSRKDDNNRYNEPFGGNFSYTRDNHFSEQNSFFGYSNFDQLMNNVSDFSNNQFVQPPLFNGYQQYGLSYGYTNPFNNNFNAYF